MIPLPHPDQARRLKTLYSFEVLDTDREKDFDDIVKLASAICEAPVSVVNLIDRDRQWFKAETGLGVRETPIDTSLCAHAILRDEFTEIPDTLQDRRMADNPLCAGDGGFRFYAGAVLVTDDGLPLGTLCILDYKPRVLTPLQRDTLKVLARQVMAQLEMRKSLRIAATLRQEIDHRLKNSLQSLSSIIRIQQKSLQSGEALAAVASIGNRLDAVSALHETLYKTDEGKNIDLGDYVTQICQYLRKIAPPGVALETFTEFAAIGPKQAVAVGTLVNEFVANSSKHGFPGGRTGVIRVTTSNTPTGFIRVCGTDDGIGLPTNIGKLRSGLGMKIAEVACMELGCALLIDRSGPGTCISFEFRPDVPL